MQYSVKLQSFEGPLDLLLHLIQKNDLDIYDIPVKQITDQYMTYIHTMQVLQLDVASEYLVMASTLLHMKSQMLLPATEDEIDEDFEYDENEDPREELMFRLIEYKKYKEAASGLKERERARSDLFSKPMTDLTPLLDEEEPSSMNVSIYDMLQAFQKLQKRKKWKEPVTSRIQRDEIPIDEKMAQIMETLQRYQGKRLFSELFAEEKEKHHIVTSFLALLELMKANVIICTQHKNFEDILISQKGEDKLEELSN
ncbi:segregation/condensation protein A [Evansella cellulosilytica]|uniref:Segregation and condensation protein A n=1 Tax=Evansella cellulosilytica (strain ATCC 21833 / DSM 2522 / FERM P-1141 / JCM 9156 / N-4) TaxID=649639 RepID=E6TYM1_EVAC2|nr:segregation/condensation protein A [Evansella cellulosilytica]ADU30071.1 chromosome segregation and condensation protein ScpA [Evansella cellulosilytica DSM 2522]